MPSIVYATDPIGEYYGKLQRSSRFASILTKMKSSTPIKDEVANDSDIEDGIEDSTEKREREKLLGTPNIKTAEAEEEMKYWGMIYLVLWMAK